MPHIHITDASHADLMADASEVRRIAARQLRWAANADDRTHAELIVREAATMLDLAVKVEELLKTA